MQKTLVAAAVSAAVMMPVGAQAEVTVYGRINNAIVFEDPGKKDKGGKTLKSTTDMQSVASQFGVKASSDLGNGLTAHGRYEFATTTDKKAAGITSTRIATAGISGGFGRIDVGNQWSAFYNTVGVDIDPTWTIGPVGGTPYRASNTIKYSNSVGPLDLELDLRMNDGKDNGDNAEGLRGNGAGLGIRVAATDNITFAFAYDTENQEDEAVAAEDKHAYTITLADMTFFTKPLDLGHEDEAGGTADSWDVGEDIVWRPKMVEKGRLGEKARYKAEGPDGSQYYCLDPNIVGQMTEVVKKHNIEGGATDRDLPTKVDLDGDKDDTQSACGKFGGSSYEYDRIAASMHVSMGQFWGNLFWSSEERTDAISNKEREIEYAGLYVGASFTDNTSGLIGYSKSETKGVKEEPSKIVLGLYHNMGGGLRLWYEGGVTDKDGAIDPDTGYVLDDKTVHKLGIRYDF